MDENEMSVIYFVDDHQDEDSEMESIYTMTSELTEHTMSTLASESVTGMYLYLPLSRYRYLPLHFDLFIAEYFEEVNGRMFPVDRNVPFILPADYRECQRLEAQHMALKLLLGANYFGPVKELLAETPNGARKRVLDLFTAEGTWCVSWC
jgi:hypothetical protein